jgi:hypothetical protein
VERIEKLRRWWHAVQKLKPREKFIWIAIISAIAIVFIVEAFNAQTFAEQIEKTLVRDTTAETARPMKEISEELDSKSGRTAEGETTSLEINIDILNITYIEFRLTWSDDIGDNDEFSLSVFGPAGFSDNAASDIGEIYLKIDVSDPETASNGTAGGTGIWKVEIEAVDCPGLVSVGGFDRDNGNEWSLVTEVHYMVPEQI